MHSHIGTIHLVGAGPGDVGLITVRGLECLQRADVVVYDRLICPDLLQHARADAELIYVGKSPDAHALSQEEINRLLIAKAREGKQVCRLKGGDPFVFGRGGEEAEELRNAGVAFTVVPGITAGIAAPAYAGIPVTHRQMSASVAFITGHEDPAKDVSAINWEHLALGIDTLVFYMGVGNLASIVEQLLGHGRPPDTSVAVIQEGTMPHQRVVAGTLATIMSLVQSTSIQPPAVVVVGEVVTLRDKLRWFDTTPLFGKTVIVTRAKDPSSEFAARLRSLGAEVIEFPVIRIADLENYERLDTAISYLKEYHWIIFTSVNGVDAFMKRLTHQGKAQDPRLFDGAEKQRIRICAQGPATARRCESYGIKVDYIPEKFIAESVAEGFAQFGIENQRILIPRAEQARELLPQKLEELGAQVDAVPAYRTILDDVNADLVKEKIAQGKVDIVTFTSSSTVRNFVKLVGEDLARDRMSNICVACIGPVTADTARSCGMHVDVVAEEFTIQGLVDTLLQHITAT